MIRRQIGLIDPLAEKPVQVLQAMLASNRRSCEVFVGNEAKVISRRKSVAMPVNEVSHHSKEGVAVSGVWIGKKEMKHS